MLVLGLTRAVHDPSAALVADGRIVAAAEEERFTRVKHAPGTPPLRAAKYCLEAAGVSGRDVEVVAYPWSLEEYRRNRWTFARRHFALLPRHALKAILRTGPRWKREMAMVDALLRDLGADPARVRFVAVPHHLAHAASAFFASGFDRAAALTADAMGEFDSAGAWDCRGTAMEKKWAVLLPDSLGTFYTAVTEFLGFEPNDGEYKTMGMAAYGDASRADLSPFCRLVEGLPWCDPRQVFPPKKYRKGGRYYGEGFVRRLGPAGDGEKAEPYVHVAAAAQDLVEKTLLGWLEGPLRALVEGAGGALCMAGGIALNVRANGRILELPFVKRLFVQAASSDAGGSLGAALWAAASLGDRVEPMEDAFLGPAFARDAIRSLLEARRIPFREPADLAGEIASLLAGGAVVARFDGRMEWGPRALGNRSILAHPGIAGMADRVNTAIKFREPWRPFCPAVLEPRAAELFGAREPSPYMTVNFRANPAWRERISQVVHVDGTARIQTVDPARAPRLHAILEAFEKRTGLPVLLNTSLNRRGEPIACTPEDALAVFFNSGLEHLAMGPFLLSKSGVDTRGSGSTIEIDRTRA